ncbi:MAG: Xaa-Pro peptidase family protein [Deltaproteobacteria bacterium]|nr:Xaa-Pro peptidase family protein [Deltaproteobacteria bacterium]
MAPDTAFEDATPGTEIRHRIGQLQSLLLSNRIDGAIIVQNSDLFYFSGTIQQSQLYIPADGDPLLMVRKSLERARSESAIQNIISFSSPRQVPELLKSMGHAIPKTLGLELDVIPAQTYLNFQSLFDQTRMIDISHLIRQIRAVKSAYEIQILREAALKSDQVAEYVKSIIKEGMTEIELAGMVEAHARKLGHQGIVRMRLWGSELFYGHLMSGASGAIPSYLASPTGGAGVSTAVAQGAGFGRIQPHEPILVDYVFAYKGYLSDHTRIYSIGKLPDDLIQAHGAMLSIQAAIIREARPGISAGWIYEMAIELATEAGYSENFMGTGDQRIRFVGHGVGLELDEYPFLAAGQKMLLQEGMVIALEPKLIFPQRGVVGIENTQLVTPNGLQQLTVFDENIIVV